MGENEKLLTKADILEGKDKREKVFIKKLNGYVEIRPLTELEWTKVQAVNSRGMVMTTKVDLEKGKKDLPKTFNLNFDMEKSSEASSEAIIMVVSYGVTSMDLTVEDVGKFKAGVAKDISDQILKLTGVSLEKIRTGKTKSAENKSEVVSSFREE